MLQALPLGTDLLLQRQQENEYDSNAIQVLLEGFSAEGLFATEFEACLSCAIHDEASLSRGQWYASALTNPLHLGYIKAKNGPAAQILILDASGITQLRVKLTATETGQPAVEFTNERR
jgi:hypothetical protein